MRIAVYSMSQACMTPFTLELSGRPVCSSTGKAGKTGGVNVAKRRRSDGCGRLRRIGKTSGVF